MLRGLAVSILGLVLLGPALVGCTIIPASDPETTGNTAGSDADPKPDPKQDPKPNGDSDGEPSEEEGGAFIAPEEEGGEGTETPPDGGAQFDVIAGTVPCESDADCVPNACCHPDQCVAKADAKDCSATMCTMDCKAGTMTCGGGCLCQDGVCAAKLWMGP